VFSNSYAELPRRPLLVLQCHFFCLGYESAASSPELEHLHYPLP
jgi:hypothetical protein